MMTLQTPRARVRARPSDALWIALALLLDSGGAAARPVSMPTRLIEAPHRLSGRIVLLEMSRFGRESWPAVERRVVQELRSLGLDPVRVATRARRPPDRLEELRRRATEYRAVGAMRIVREGDRRRVEIWLHDAVTGKTVSRRVEVKRPEGPDAVSIVALRAVEVLNSSLIVLRMRSSRRRRAPPVVKRAPATVERMVDDRVEDPPVARRWRAWIGPALAADLGESQLGALATLQLGVGLRPLAWISCELELDLPLHPASIEEERGSADLRLFRLTALISIEPWAAARWSPSLALGAGALAVNAAGSAASSSFQGRSQWAAVAWIALRSALSLRVVKRLRLLAVVSIGAALPSVIVRFAEDVIATVGQPLLSGQLALEWRWSSF